MGTLILTSQNYLLEEVKKKKKEKGEEEASEARSFISSDNQWSFTILGLAHAVKGQNDEWERERAMRYYRRASAIEQVLIVIKLLINAADIMCLYIYIR